MKPQLSLIALSGFVLGSGSLTADVPPPPIPESVDWFLHLDVESLRESQTGAALLEEFRQIDFTKGKFADFPFDPILILNGMQGLTVFGPMPDFATGEEAVDGILVFQGTPDMLKILRGMVAGMELEAPGKIEEVAAGPDRILSIDGGQVYGALLGEEVAVIGKSLPRLQAYLDTRRGTAARLDIMERFPSYRMGHTGFFFGAFVEGMGNFDQLPAQARILQMTEAVSVQLGEFGDELDLLASLVTADATTGRQVYNVLQGILAMFMLTQNGQPDVAALLESAAVGLDDRTVSLKVGYPVEKARAWTSTLAEMAKAAMQEEKEPAPVEEAAPESESAPGAEPEPEGAV